MIVDVTRVLITFRCIGGRWSEHEDFTCTIELKHIMEIGTPVCDHCGEDMELDSCEVDDVTA